MERLKSTATVSPAEMDKTSPCDLSPKNYCEVEESCSAPEPSTTEGCPVFAEPTEPNASEKDENECVVLSTNMPERSKSSDDCTDDSESDDSDDSDSDSSCSEFSAAPNNLCCDLKPPSPKRLSPNRCKSGSCRCFAVPTKSEVRRNICPKCRVSSKSSVRCNSKPSLKEGKKASKCCSQRGMKSASVKFDLDDQKICCSPPRSPSNSDFCSPGNKKRKKSKERNSSQERYPERSKLENDGVPPQFCAEDLVWTPRKRWSSEDIFALCKLLSQEKSVPGLDGKNKKDRRRGSSDGRISNAARRSTVNKIRSSVGNLPLRDTSNKEKFLHKLRCTPDKRSSASASFLRVGARKKSSSSRPLSSVPAFHKPSDSYFIPYAPRERTSILKSSIKENCPTAFKMQTPTSCLVKVPKGKCSKKFRFRFLPKTHCKGALCKPRSKPCEEVLEPEKDTLCLSRQERISRAISRSVERLMPKRSCRDDEDDVCAEEDEDDNSNFSSFVPTTSYDPQCSPTCPPQYPPPCPPPCPPQCLPKQRSSKRCPSPKKCPPTPCTPARPKPVQPCPMTTYAGQPVCPPVCEEINLAASTKQPASFNLQYSPRNSMCPQKFNPEILQCSSIIQPPASSPSSVFCCRFCGFKSSMPKKNCSLVEFFQKRQRCDACDKGCNILTALLHSLILLLLAASAVLVLVWAYYFRKGVAFSGDANQVLNLHPVLMVVGFITISGFSMLIYRIGRCCNHSYMKCLHFLFHALAIPLIVLGVMTAFDYHQQRKLPDLVSLHSWVGAVTVVVFALQFSVGFFSFMLLNCCEGMTIGFRQAILPFHATFGIITFLLAIASCLTGLMQRVLWLSNDKQDIWFYYKTPLGEFEEGIFINIIAAVLILVGILLPTSLKRPVMLTQDMVCSARF